jgi:hypothetical protein
VNETKPKPYRENSEVSLAAPPGEHDIDTVLSRAKFTTAAEKALANWVSRYADCLQTSAVDLMKRNHGDEVQKIDVDRAADALEPQPEPPMLGPRLPEALNYFGGAFFGAGISLLASMIQSGHFPGKAVVLTVVFTIVGAWLAPGLFRSNK